MRLLQGPPIIFWPLKEVNGGGGGDEVCWGLKTTSRVPLWQPRGGDRGERRMKKTGEGRGRGLLQSLSFSQPLETVHVDLAPSKPPSQNKLR